MSKIPPSSTPDALAGKPPEAAGGQPRNRRLPAHERRGQILDAALHEFSERGFGAARMDDIAARAGLSKGGLYAHFESKDAVFRALMQRMLMPNLLFEDQPPGQPPLAQAAPPEVTLFAPGRAPLPVVIPDAATPAEADAASELQKYLARVCGRPVMSYWPLTIMNSRAMMGIISSRMNNVRLSLRIRSIWRRARMGIWRRPESWPRGGRRSLPDTAP